MQETASSRRSTFGFLEAEPLPLRFHFLVFGCRVLLSGSGILSLALSVPFFASRIFFGDRIRFVCRGGIVALTGGIGCLGGFFTAVRLCGLTDFPVALGVFFLPALEGIRSLDSLFASSSSGPRPSAVDVVESSQPPSMIATATHQIPLFSVVSLPCVGFTFEPPGFR